MQTKKDFCIRYMFVELAYLDRSSSCQTIILVLCISNGTQNESFATDMGNEYLPAHQYRIGEENFYHIINL